jgi:hypothetical protein
MLRYPYFHPKRPKFFNIVTLFLQIFANLNDGVASYLKNSWNLTDDSLNNGFDTYQIAYEKYVRWEESGGKELQLAANRLTNRQLFWIAAARVASAKFHPRVPLTFDPAQRLINHYHHVFFKSNKGFQEAFKCVMTAEEKETHAEFIRKYFELVSIKDKIFQHG